MKTGIILIFLIGAIAFSYWFFVSEASPNDKQPLTQAETILPKPPENGETVYNPKVKLNSIKRTQPK